LDDNAVESGLQISPLLIHQDPPLPDTPHSPATSHAHNAQAMVLVSILNWNGLPDTLACIARIAPREAGSWNVVVIDNGSTEDPRAEIQARYPEIECIRLPENIGFTGGQNFGMQLAIDRGFESVLLLNNDCEIDPDTLEELQACLQSNAKLAAVSPLIYCTEQRDKPQMVAAWFDWAKHQSVRPSQPDAPRPLSMPTMLAGTALLLRCAALRQIGLLDNRYFAYYEDNDLSARLGRQGWQAQYCQSAKVWHSSRPTHAYSEMALYLSARNACLFWRTHTPPEFRRGMFRHLLAQSLYEIALLKKAGADAKCKAVVAGFWAAQRQQFGAPPRTFSSPAWLRWFMCAAPFLGFELLMNPVNAVRSRLLRGGK
jgi:GT2 family glycosyltransferase